MITGSQLARLNWISNKPQSALVQPFTAQEFAEFSGIPYSTAIKPMLDGFIQAACQACIKHTDRELLSRKWAFNADRYPVRQAGYTGIGIMDELSAWWISLPIMPVTKIESVKIDDEVVEPDLVDLDSTPARVWLCGNGVIEIEYTAGSATAAAIDPMLILGIKMLTSYLYERRGACDAADAIKASGAGGLWSPFRSYGGSI